MTVRIIICGESQCEIYAHIALIADYLAKNLPEFCFKLIEKPVIEWQNWLNKVNLKYKWHHCTSPLVWKETLIGGSKPVYIGGANEFLEYCNSYYKFDSFVNIKKLTELSKSNVQYKMKLKENLNDYMESKNKKYDFNNKKKDKNNFVISITGANSPFIIYLLSELLEITSTPKRISKIYLFDNESSEPLILSYELECSFVAAQFPFNVVKHVKKLGLALTKSDLLIILDHQPFQVDATIGEWLETNRTLMQNLSEVINASAPSNLRILFPNLGPSCYNATVLLHSLKSVQEKNIVVATSDLGLEIISQIAEIGKVPSKNIYCPPVWGFVGINHLVDVRTAVHKYNSFYPYERFEKVNKSTLTLGVLVPELRTLEYLMYDDETLWLKIAERNEKKHPIPPINKFVALINTIKLWLFGTTPHDIVSLGILCDGTFGLNFNGLFSQPAQFQDGFWTPATDFLLPRDAQMKLNYLENIAKFTLNLEKNALPFIYPCCPPYRKPKRIKTNIVKKRDVVFSNEEDKTT